MSDLVKLRVDWKTIHGHSSILARSISASLNRTIKDYKIVAVSRGGLIPATLISHQLDMPIAKVIDGTSTVFNTDKDENSYIVVDDICDTGDTFSRIRQVLPNSWLVSLFLKPKGRAFRNISVQEVSQDCWIVMPWELDNAETIRDQDRRK